MITGKDIYEVLAAIVPLYVAMILAYGSVRWWGIFTPDQCSGINRFVAVFAVPLLSFHFISSNNIYAMNFRFIAADSLQKVVILFALFIWQSFSKKGSSEWMITLFSLSTLPNTLVMGIPLLSAMYGPFSGDLMVQIVVLQSVIWYTLMLFMFEYRGAKLLIGEQFPETAASITSFKVESDVISLNGREPLQADAEIGDDGRLHVVVKRSNTPSLASSRSNYYYNNKSASRGNNINSFTSMNMTPRASNLTGVEIYSVQSSREPTPRGSSFNQNDFYAMFSSSKAASPKHGYTSSYGGGGDVYSLQSSKVATPRTSNFEEEMMTMNKNNSKNKKGGGGTRSMSGELFNSGGGFVPSYPPPNPMLFGGSSTSGGGIKKKEGGGNNNNKDLHMFVWSSSASSPVSEGHMRNNAVVHRAASTDFAVVDASKAALRREFAPASTKGTSEFGENNNNSPGRKAAIEDKLDQGDIEEAVSSSKLGPMSGSSPYTNQKKVEETEEEKEEEVEGGNNKNHQMPPASVMTRLILIMVWRKLIRNPNTYSSLAGLIWSLVSFR